MSGLKTLHNHKHEILQIGKENGIKNIRVFGSVIRGEDRPDSDFDLLVEVDEDRTLFDVIRFKQSIEYLLGRDVDVISDRAVHATLKEEIIDKAVRL